MPRTEPDDVRFARAYTVRDDGCWAWQLWRDADGYGRFWSNVIGRTILAHRWVYARVRGVIAEGLEIDHLCKHPWCVNPAHLEAVPHVTNIRRGKLATATHCKRGHAFAGQNLLTKNGARRCRICLNKANGEWNRRNRAAQQAVSV